MHLLIDRTRPEALLFLVCASLLFPIQGAWAQEEAPSEDAQDAETTPASDDPDSFEASITVTAQKRDETLQEVPMSVTVLGGETLERQRVEDFQDLVAVVPGLSVTSSTPGTTRLTLRGINAGGVASTVGIYVDDVPYGSSSGLANGAVLSGDFDTFDLARVEVLRGPQGTLYGASSLGGVIKYVPNRAHSDGYEGRLRLGLETVAGGDLGPSLAGLINVPAGEKFAIRANGFYRTDEGYIDSVGNHPIPSLTDPNTNIFDGTLREEGINSVERSGLRLTGRIRPSDRLEINLAAQRQEIDSDAPNIVDADPATLEPLDRDLVQSRYQEQFSDTEYEIFSANLDWFMESASLQSVTSYSTLEQQDQTDTAFATALTGGPPLASLVTLLFGDPATQPLSVIFPNAVTTDKLTQELRLVSSKSEHLEWLLGAYYTDEESEILQELVGVNAGTQIPATGVPLLGDITLTSTYEEIALFANATWHVSPRFDLSFGGRASDNEQVASQLSDGVLVGGLTEFAAVESSETPVTYSVSPRFEIGRGASIYARLATGFRPGGPNVLPPGAPPDTPSTYDADELTSYEVGYRANSPRGAVTLDLAAYYLDWEDIQLLAVVNNFGINGNGGTAVSKGAEFTLGLRPLGGLLLSLNGAYTDAYLTQDTDAIVGGLDGDPLSWVPEWSFGFDADYAWSVGTTSLAHVGVSVGFTDERPVDFSNRDANGGIRRVDSYTTVDLSGGIDFGAWSLELYGQNLTDEEGITSLDSGGFLPNGALALGLIRPRAIGLTLDVTF